MPYIGLTISGRRVEEVVVKLERHERLRIDVIDPDRRVLGRPRAHGGR